MHIPLILTLTSRFNLELPKGLNIWENILTPQRKALSPPGNQTRDLFTVVIKQLEAHHISMKHPMPTYLWGDSISAAGKR